MKKINFTKEEVDNIINLYNQGYSSRKLAKLYSVSKFVILNQIKHLDFRNTQRIYFRNSSKCEHILNEQDAYFLGFFMADGYNNEKEGRITISLAECDKEILVKFKDYFETNQSILQQNRLEKNHQNIVILNINDKEISKNLAIHGCVQNKTFKTTFPKISTELIKHFIRGYFDGDGSIYNCVVSFTGTESFLLDLNEELYKSTNINYSTIRTRHPERNNNIRETRYIGKNKVKEIYEYMYSDATIFLERKKQRFEKHLHIIN
jgi:intein/homing endonuclease